MQKEAVQTNLSGMWCHHATYMSVQSLNTQEEFLYTYLSVDPCIWPACTFVAWPLHEAHCHGECLAIVLQPCDMLAIQAAEILGKKLNVVVENMMKAFTPEAPHLHEASLVLVCTSTYGSGAPPPTATKYTPL